MKMILGIGIIFIFALAVAGFGVFNYGEVSIYLLTYKLDFSLNLLLFLWVISFVLGYYLLRLLININRLPNKISRRRNKIALMVSRRNLNYAGLYYFEGKYFECYASALKSLKTEVNQDNKFLAYMLAYKSANFMRDNDKETKVLEELSAFKDEKWQLAKYLAIAENLYYEQKFGLAIDNLNHALAIDRNHVAARRLLLKVYLSLENYQKSYEVLSWLIKRDSLHSHKLELYKVKILTKLFNDASDSNDLDRLYKKLNQQEQNNFMFGKSYFQALLRLNQYEKAFIFITEHIKNNSLQLVYPELILELAKKLTEESLINQLLSVVENLLNENKDNYQLLLALGILSYHKRLWSKSQSYLEASLNLQKTVDGYLYLSYLADAINNEELLLSCQRKLLLNIKNIT